MIPPDRARLLRIAREGFAHHVVEEPEWQWSVPGRIEIFGKHTDYAGGCSLLAAVPHGFMVVARARTDHVVRVIDARHHEVAVIDAAAFPTTRTGWANYAAVTVHRLARNFPGAALGADIAIASDLPRAAGLSSSSALVVGLASALIARAGLPARDDWKAVVTSTEDLAWYLGCVENGLTYKTLTGTAGVGTHGGSQDHTAILGCRAGHVSQYGFMPVRALGEVAMPAGWRFVVLSSGVHADKAGSVRERYNRASLAVRALVDLWQRENGTEGESLASALASGPDGEARLRALVARVPVPGFGAGELTCRLTQFVQETARVPEAAQAFAHADTRALGALTRASQQDAEALLGNQIPETVALARLAYDHGAFAASSFGAGFGGSVWALTTADEAEVFAARWLAAYIRTCAPTGRVEHFICTPAQGAIALTES